MHEGREVEEVVQEGFVQTSLRIDVLGSFQLGDGGDAERCEDMIRWAELVVLHSKRGDAISPCIMCTDHTDHTFVCFDVCIM